MRAFAPVLVLAACAAPVCSAGGGTTISSRGVRVIVPAGWEQVEPAGDGAVVDPRTVLVVGTAGVRARPSACQIAAYRVQSAGAVVVIVRWRTATSGGGSPPRGRAPLRELRLRRPSFECFSGRGDAAQLALGPHSYQVNVLVGDRAAARTVREAIAVARSFDLDR